MRKQRAGGVISFVSVTAHSVSAAFGPSVVRSVCLLAVRERSESGHTTAELSQAGASSGG